MFGRLKLWLSRNDSYVIADPRDNSITFSKGLCKEMDLDNLTEAKVFAFEVRKVGEKRSFGFTLNPKFDQKTQLADIMYNSKHKCVGFESLNPTVNRIFYDYGIIIHDMPHKLSVKKSHIKRNDLTYYEICRPQSNK